MVRRIRVAPLVAWLLRVTDPRSGVGTQSFRFKHWSLYNRVLLLCNQIDHTEKARLSMSGHTYVFGAPGAEAFDGDVRWTDSRTQIVN